jgi:aerobic-type carbon monoxide dehydrogenase small subunit (CoxS/CutS family)
MMLVSEGINIDMSDSKAMRVVAHPILEPLPSAALVTFRFDGRDVEGQEGEPIAVALLAAGTRVFRTMPRRGDPRGGYCMIGRCADCMVIVDGVPGIRSCVTPVRAGLDVRTQRGLGELDDRVMSERER